MEAAAPADPLRSVPAASLLDRALAAAKEAGVTRLADITRLDRIGFPVWQAVRPCSRALSVHQGKGATDADAQLGALLEAVESHAAETFQASSTSCAFDDLPANRRAPTISDFALSREDTPSVSQALAWVEGEPLPGGTGVLLPLPVASLDFTQDTPSRFDRSSNGVATAATRGEAIASALHELIERDAILEWQALDIGDRIRSTVDPQSIPFAWYWELEQRIVAAGASIQCFHVPSLTGTPVFACEINDRGKAALPYRCANGRGAHALPEVALFKAVAEACQARATFIAGARDDLLPSLYSAPEHAVTVAFALPPPPGMGCVDFAAVPAGPVKLDALAAAVAAAGYGRSAVVVLAEPHGFCVVRVFVCGLGSVTRRRRPPVH